MSVEMTRMIDMKGSLPAGHYMALSAAVTHLFLELDNWETLPDWLCLTSPDEASMLKKYLSDVRASLEPTARELATEFGPKSPASAKLELVKGESNDPER